MPMCIECKSVVGVGELNVVGLCIKCSSSEAKEAKVNMVMMDERFIRVKAEIESKTFAEKALMFKEIMITTENIINIPIEERIEVIFSEYVYGLNIIKDFFTSIRDFVGGRVGSIEKPIHDTNKKIIEEMKIKAIALGGNAVIGLNINYQTGGGFISVIAVGTVVKLKKD